MAWQIADQVMNHAPETIRSGTRTVLIVLGHCVHQSQRHTRTVSIKQDKLARLCGMHPEAVRRALVRLEKLGHRVRVGERACDGTASTYRVPDFPAPDGCDCTVCRAPTKGRGSESGSPPENGGQASEASESPYETSGRSPHETSGLPDSEPLRKEGQSPYETSGPTGGTGTTTNRERSGARGSDPGVGVQGEGTKISADRVRVRIETFPPHKCPRCLRAGSKWTEDGNGNPVAKCDHRFRVAVHDAQEGKR